MSGSAQGTQRCVVLATCALIVLVSACADPSVPPAADLADGCTVGAAMGSATADGRPIAWKNRDMTDGNNRLFYDSGGTFAKDDTDDYDQYVNSLFADIEANLRRAVALVRQHWHQNGFDVNQAGAITDEAAATAWHTMDAMCQGSDRTLNQPPRPTDLEVVAGGDGYTIDLSRQASDQDGAIASTSWSLGDGTDLSGATVTHTYGTPGTYLIRCRVKDDAGARNNAWKLVTIPIEVPNLSPVATAAGDARH